VALAHGIVMGGGIGIAGHCAFRFATTEARFAMPEAAIGFMCDVGVNFILAKAPAHRALAFAMTGVPVGVADALALGLTDCAIEAARFDEVRAGIAAAAGAARIEAALGALMQAEMAPVGEAVLCAAADRQVGLDWTDAEAIVGAAGHEPQLALLTLRSPTSLVAIAESHHAARRMADIGAVLAADLRLARLLSRLPDFAEGVRAVLVDKDQKPRWRPNSLAGVDRASIRAVVGAA
jgi:enoyl-CoA hydratase